MDANAARDLTMRLTGCNEPTLVPFGTEAGLFQQLSMEVVVCGPGSIAQAHMADEYISRAQLAAGLTMLDGIGQHCTR
jgi:acetylornithine deacetylase